MTFNNATYSELRTKQSSLKVLRDAQNGAKDRWNELAKQEQAARAALRRCLESDTTSVEQVKAAYEKAARLTAQLAAVVIPDHEEAIYKLEAEVAQLVNKIVGGTVPSAPVRP